MEKGELIKRFYGWMYEVCEIDRLEQENPEWWQDLKSKLDDETYPLMEWEMDVSLSPEYQQWCLERDEKTYSKIKKD
jgi:hypothetical protein